MLIALMIKITGQGGTSSANFLLNKGCTSTSFEGCNRA